jgi:teichuronic acid biosynthesis glycosyltransferase TuaC
MAQIQVLSLSTVFPRPGEETLGIFVQSRLEHLANLLSVKVVAPVAVIDYAALGQRTAPIPARRHHRDLDVFYPRWFYPPMGGFTHTWFMAARLIPFFRHLRREYAFDVIDSHFGHPEGIAAGIISRFLRVPFTITLRGNETMHAESPAKRRWMSWAFRRAARLITVSERLREFAISLGAEPQRVTTISNGIDTALFYPRNHAQMRRQLGMPDDRPVILSAGYLIERKGHHHVIQALADLRRQGSRAELWILGGPGREGQFEKVIHEKVAEYSLQDVVHFPGAVKPNVLADYMTAADVFCLASSREGSPNVVHEALACGTPAIVYDVGGVPDLLPSAEYGAVVPPGDQAALTVELGAALSRTWNREKIAAWGGSRSWAKVAQEVAVVLRDSVTDSKGKV